MKPKKLKIFKIKDKIYEENIFLVIGDKFEFKKYLGRKYNAPRDFPIKGGGMSICFEDAKNADRDRIVWLELFENKIFEIGLLNHELLHLVFEVLKDLGFKYSKDSEEAYTYYLQWITVQVFEKLSKV